MERNSGGPEMTTTTEQQAVICLLALGLATVEENK